MSGVKGRSGGRNARTVADHKRDGTFDPSRHSGYQNPEPPIGKPVPPKELTGDAKDEWDRMIVRLEASKTLSLVDDAALYQYCRLFAETEALSASPEDSAKNCVQIRQGRMALRAYLVEFGLTPAARSRVRVIGSQDEAAKSPLARLQQQARRIQLVK